MAADHKIQVYRGSSGSLPILAQGQFGFCTDNDDVYIGNGVGNVKVATEVSGATENNFAAFDSDGLPKDSGHSWAEVNPLPNAIVIPILGDRGTPDTYIHFQVQVDDGMDFASPAIDVESKDDQSNWYYFDWSNWVSLPSGGVLAYWQYEENDYNVPVLKKCIHLDSPEGYVDSRAAYVIPDDDTLSPKNTYYCRWRQHDGTEYGSWHGKILVL